MPDQHDPIRTALLRRIGRYRIHLKPLLEKRLFYGKESGQFLKKLEDKGLITVHGKKSDAGGALPSGIAWVQLTKDGCIEAEVSLERAAFLPHTAMHQHLAILFACEGQTEDRRIRLEPSETQKLLGLDSVPNNVPYVVSEEPSGQAVFRTYVSTGSPERAVQKVRDIRDEFLLSPKLKPFVDCGQLGVLVLADEKPKLFKLSKSFKRSQSGELPLDELIHVKISLGPSPNTIAEAMKGGRKKRADAEEDL